MQVICNSSPLIALLSVDKLGLLGNLFKSVIIPQAVCDEVFNTSKASYEVESFDYIKVERVKEKQFVKVLSLNLGLGESEVIGLALEKNISNVILDDKQARKIAERMGLKVIGTLGILLLAKQKCLIEKVKPLILEMQEKINFRLDKKILNKLDEYH